ncbi:MAG: DUF6090 family protein [Flavobacteriaceae bacterium]
MINFFRKKRKKLADENKAIKYARYAFGEIVLVVIGILIALQLNSWKQEHQQIAKTNVYIDNIIDDIINDTISINDELNQYQEYKTNVENYFKFFEEGTHTIDELIDSAFTVNSKLFAYNPINHTYKDMLASGNSSLLGELQRAKLIALSNQQNLFHTINMNVVNSIITEGHEASKYLDVDMSDSDFFEILNIQQKDKPKGLLHVHNSISASYGLVELYERFGGRIKQKSKEAILKLQEQKNK